MAWEFAFLISSPKWTDDAGPGDHTFEDYGYIPRYFKMKNKSLRHMRLTEKVCKPKAKKKKKKNCNSLS